MDANVPLFSSYLCLITGTLLSDVWFNKIRWNFKAISNLEEVLPASLFVHLKVLKCFVDVNLFLCHHVLKISFYIICSAIWTRCQGLIGDITTTMLWQKIQKWKSWKYFCDFFARTEMSLDRNASGPKCFLDWNVLKQICFSYWNLPKLKFILERNEPGPNLA